MLFAARVSDTHTCPAANGTVAHAGGPVLLPGIPTVLIGGQPAAVKGSLCTCVGAVDKIAKGSSTVKINGQAAARMGDTTDHGGVITSGCTSVIIGG